MNLSNKVMLGEVSKLCLLIATLTLSVDGSGVCERGHTWWDKQRGACIPCTRCEPQHLIVKLPCEIHRDTLCQTVHELRIYPFNTKHSDNDTRVQISDYEYYEDAVDYGEVSDGEGEVQWDLQTSTLALAASGCVVFFLVVLYLTFNHSKQWKVLKQALRADVQDLSAKLKLMEAGETPAEPVVPVDHHIYCNIHVAKDNLLGPPSTKKGLGNVYTQEKHSS